MRARRRPWGAWHRGRHARQFPGDVLVVVAGGEAQRDHQVNGQLRGELANATLPASVRGDGRVQDLARDPRGQRANRDQIRQPPRTACVTRQDHRATLPARSLCKRHSSAYRSPKRVLQARILPGALVSIRQNKPLTKRNIGRGIRRCTATADRLRTILNNAFPRDAPSESRGPVERSSPSASTSSGDDPRAGGGPGVSFRARARRCLDRQRGGPTAARWCWISRGLCREHVFRAPGWSDARHVGSCHVAPTPGVLRA
ncbi:hypothetical protein HD596_005593 [Nonomuraea jabiensis]|uniref:Uncharacterized protein n=1 Tax=Nonomuraea jabiensis TaxID=882448 RepID=A0A7W9G802_9ACTN|nr:hypothetical protein [Nonomuraea jabiensis]